MTFIDLILIALFLGAANVAFDYAAGYIESLYPPKPLKFKSADDYAEWIDQQQEFVNTHYEELRKLQQKQ